TETHHRAPIRSVLGDDCATVRFRHLADDRQAKTRTGHRPGRGRPVEAIEHEWPILVRESRTVVPHPQLAAGERDLDRTAFATPLPCVLEQIPDSALHPVRVAVDDRGLEPIGLPGDPGEARAGLLDRFLHELVEIERLLLELGATACELEEAGDE